MTGDETRFYAGDGLHVAIYDAMHAEIPGGDDVAFFRSLAEETGGPVLELGCGSGRVTIPLAVAGFEVTGIDRSGAMLDRARRKVASLDAALAGPVRFVEGDFENAIAGGPYGLVFAAFRVFMSVLESADQLRLLETIRERLRPDGILAIDVFDPRFDLLGPDAPPWKTDLGTFTNPDTGRPVRVTTLDRATDPINQRFVEHWAFEELDELGHPSRTEVETLTLRWTFRHEFDHLLHRAGFEPVAEYSDFDGSPPAYAAEQIWIARRAAT